jgi:membrane associated rhomboid family serine protease
VFPLKDDIPTRSWPLMTVTLIILNAAGFLYQFSLQGAGPGGAKAAHAFVVEFGLIPCRLTGACSGAPDAPSALITVFTSMFLHGGLLHILGNMLYLWIFGNSVEDTLGHGRFVAFYLVAGAVAALAQTMVNTRSHVPMIGASGAVSGVLGAYLLLFPHARVLCLIMLGFFVRLIHVPAVIVLGFWIVVQFISGYVAVALGGGGGRVGSGVAWFAHIGGFLAGMALLFAFRPRRPARW